MPDENIAVNTSASTFVSEADIRLHGKYITRTGTIVTLTQEVDHQDWDFIGDNNRFYTADGAAGRFDIDSLDLISEAFAIEVGKKYRTRGTDEIITIVALEDKTSPLFRASHPFLGDDGEVYTIDGLFNEKIESEYDLVKCV